MYLNFYDYEKCYIHYHELVMCIRQARICGEIILAKPVLLLSLIDGIEEGLFSNNHFILSKWLEERYLKLMKHYTTHSQFPAPADISNPFWHLSSDGFWHLHCKIKPRVGVTPSKQWLKENVDHAWLDEDLWVLLQNRDMRLKLRELIINKKLLSNNKF